MVDIVVTGNSPNDLLSVWLQELQAKDRAKGTIRRYKSAIESFFAWYRARLSDRRLEHRFAHGSPGC
jgi:hypothetical protein